MAWNTRDCLKIAQAPYIEKNVTCLFHNQENLCSDLDKAKYYPEVSFTFLSSSKQMQIALNMPRHVLFIHYTLIFTSKLSSYNGNLGTAVAQLLRCCATNRKVAGSIPA